MRRLRHGARSILRPCYTSFEGEPVSRDVGTGGFEYGGPRAYVHNDVGDNGLVLGPVPGVTNIQDAIPQHRVQPHPATRQDLKSFCFRIPAAVDEVRRARPAGESASGADSGQLRSGAARLLRTEP